MPLAAARRPPAADRCHTAERPALSARARRADREPRWRHGDAGRGASTARCAPSARTWPCSRAAIAIAGVGVRHRRRVIADRGPPGPRSSTSSGTRANDARTPTSTTARASRACSPCCSGDESRVVVASGADRARSLKQAVVAIEDERFYEPHGRRLRRHRAGASSPTCVAGHTVQGGSTITQQFIKNTYIDPDQRPSRRSSRKIREAVLAYQLEKRWSKDKILTNYLNTIYFGQGAYGIEMAARTFFGTQRARASRWRRRRCSPASSGTRATTTRSTTRAARRGAARLVLDAMRRPGHDLDEDAAAGGARAAAAASPPACRASHLAPYFVEYVIQQLVAAVRRRDARSAAACASTPPSTRDVQRAANQAASSILGRTDDPAVSIVAIDPAPGEVKALVGGRDFGRQQFDVAVQGRRQPGSAFKPFALAAALRQGMSPTVRLRLRAQGDRHGRAARPWTVSTYSRRLRRPDHAGRRHRRVRQHRLRRPVDDGRARRTSPPTAARAWASRARSGRTRRSPSAASRHGVSPLEMAAAYATLADRRRAPERHDAGRRPARPHLDHPGHRRPGPRARRATRSCAQRVLQPWQAGVSHLDPAAGDRARHRARAPRWAGRRAGKTGTTTNFADAWFCGYTPDLAAAVWVGYPGSQRDDGRARHPGSPAAPSRPMIWRRFMAAALTGVPAHAFPSFKLPAGHRRPSSARAPASSPRAGAPSGSRLLLPRPGADQSCTFHGPRAGGRARREGA